MYLYTFMSIYAYTYICIGHRGAREGQGEGQVFVSGEHLGRVLEGLFYMIIKKAEICSI